VPLTVSPTATTRATSTWTKSPTLEPQPVRRRVRVTRPQRVRPPAPEASTGVARSAGFRVEHHYLRIADPDLGMANGAVLDDDPGELFRPKRRTQKFDQPGAITGEMIQGVTAW
jgi:hypothetical protein